MKLLHVCIVLSILGIGSIFSQDWMIANPDYAYHYVLHDELGQESDSLEAYTLSTDSIAGDTSWLTPRVMPALIGGPFKYPYPFFLQYEMIHRPDQSVWFRDTGSFVILAPGPSTPLWLYDTLAGITVILDSTYEASSYQQADSFRMILLSSGDTIIQSKSYGILRFPEGYGQNRYFRQIGIEGIVGFNFPDFYDIYDWELGDLYEYKTIYEYAESGADYDDTVYTRTTIRQFEILEIDSISEGIALKILDKVHIGDTTYVIWGGPNTREEVHASTTIRRDTIFKDEVPAIYWSFFDFILPDIFDKFPHQSMIFGTHCPPVGLIEYDTVNSNKWGQRPSMEIDLLNCYLGCHVSPPFGLQFIDCDRNSGADLYFWQGSVIWIKGLGLERAFMDYFWDLDYDHNHQSIQLMGSQKGDTILGTLSPMSFFPVSIEEEAVFSSQLRIDFYPNPAKKVLHIQLPPSVPIVHIEILDFTGRVVYKDSFSGSGRHEVSLTEWISGMYIVKSDWPGSKKSQWNRVSIVN